MREERLAWSETTVKGSRASFRSGHQEKKEARKNRGCSSAEGTKPCTGEVRQEQERFAAEKSPGLLVMRKGKSKKSQPRLKKTIKPPLVHGSVYNAALTL